MLINPNVYQPQSLTSLKQKNSFTRNKAEPQQGVYRHVIKLTISEDAQQRYASYKRQQSNQTEEKYKEKNGRKLQHFIDVNIDKSNKNVERAMKTLAALSFPKKTNVSNNQMESIKKMGKFDIVKFDMKITNEKAMSRVFDSYNLHVKKVYA